MLMSKSQERGEGNANQLEKGPRMVGHYWAHGFEKPGVGFFWGQVSPQAEETLPRGRIKD